MATITVRSASALLSAIRNPQYGRGDVIDATAVGGNNRVPSGVYDGGGVTVRTNTRKQEFLRLEQSGTTLRNFTLEGDKTDTIRSRGLWDYRDGASAWATAAEGIGIRTSGALIENVSCHGWTHAGIKVGASGASRYTPTIRNCDLSDCNARALGYGVVVYSGHPTIEWCWFDNNRHDVAGGGRANVGYHARYNHVGPRGRLYGFELHGPASDHVTVERNTFEDKRNPGGSRRTLIVNRGSPNNQSTVANNWFKGALTTHFAGNSRSRYTFQNNHEGSSTPPTGVGQPARSDDGDDDGAAPDSTVSPWDWPEHVRARRRAIAQQVRPTVAAFAHLRDSTTNR
jgi:hypothetical protein